MPRCARPYKEPNAAAVSWPRGELRFIGLNDYLAAHPLWARRLLDIEHFQQQRTLDLIQREYNDEHYGHYLRAYKDYTDALRERVLCGTDDEITISLKDEIFSAPLRLFLRIQRRHMKSTLEKYAPRRCFCELGCGFGSNLIWLARELGGEVYGGDYSQNAVSLGRMLGLDVCHFNFYQSESFQFIRESTTVFTSHAIEQVNDAQIVIDALKALRGRINSVIHFEPLYANDRQSAIGQLRNKYAVINDYNRNLLGVLQNDRDLEIISLERDVYGRNPLNSTSIVVWRFA